MLDAIERVHAVTSLPLSAQPNAGIPRSVEGRNIYLCSPEYMASYARKFVAAGVRIVGGCCGTTPDHIRVMKSALRVGEARGKTASVQVAAGTTAPAATPTQPLAGAVASGSEAGPRRIYHHGRGRSSQRHRHPQGIGGRTISEISGRGRGQYSRQSPRLGPHEQSGALVAGTARSLESKPSCITPAATAMCSASRAICWERPRSASGT